MWLKLWEMGFIWQISLCKLFLPEKSWFWSLPLSASCSLWSEGPFPQHEAALMTSTRSQADTGEAPGTVSWINFPPANCSLGYFLVLLCKSTIAGAPAALYRHFDVLSWEECGKGGKKLAESNTVRGLWSQHRFGDVQAERRGFWMQVDK